MHVNGELFFPFGVGLIVNKESDLMLVNKTHFNIIYPLIAIDKKLMDMIYTTQQGKIKVIYSIGVYKWDHNSCTNLNDEEYYRKAVEKINEFKEHPNLLLWYINDEVAYYFNKYLRNRTLTIHEIDPNHPSYTVIFSRGEVNYLMNTTDIMGLDHYPIGRFSIRNVNYYFTDAYKELLEAKPFIPVVQIFDWAAVFWRRQRPDFQPRPPTLQEMRSMSWQALVAGAKGLLFYSLYDIIYMDKYNPVEERWKDVIEFTDEIWKYNKINYIVIVNLERKKEIFKINLLEKYKIHKEFGLGKFNKNGTEIIFDLEPIDVIMITYSKNSKSHLLVIFLIIIIIIIAIGAIVFFARKYLMNKYKTKNFIDSVSKLMNDDN